MKLWGLLQTKEMLVLLDKNIVYKVRVHSIKEGINLGIKKKGGKWIGMFISKQKLVFKGW